ncbi:MAG: hypothetical protein C0504_07650 [Candidatus Solibacter sp.]|nr:hypothetical protein [Candidatus Solibacter sp.]
MLMLIRAFLTPGVMEDGLVGPVDERTPRGGLLSTLLSDIMLDEFDRELERRGMRTIATSTIEAGRRSAETLSAEFPNPHRPHSVYMEEHGGSMQFHVKLLAVLHIVFACLAILVGLGLFVMFGGLAAIVAVTESGSDAFAGMAVLGAIGTFLLVLLLVLSLPGLISGVGLLYMKPWARILGLVVSALNLLSFPFGTALGIYGLWVLVNQETGRLFDQRPAPVRAA